MLIFFRLALIRTIYLLQEYGAGRMLTGEVKAKLISVLSEMVEKHQAARALVTEEVKFLSLEGVQALSPIQFLLSNLQMVDAFMAVRPMPFMFS